MLCRGIAALVLTFMAIGGIYAVPAVAERVTSVEADGPAGPPRCC